jgi:hypothetical protein
MMRQSIKLPVFKPEISSQKEVSFDDFVESFKRSLDQAPSFIAELKKADNEGWQQAIDEVVKYARSNPELANLVRTKQQDNADIHIGEPNWAALVGGVLGAFVIGFMIGTACYKAGPCNVVK